MKNKLIDLNNALFEQLERVQHPEKDDDLNTEIKKAETMTGLAKNIIDIHKIAYNAAKSRGEELDYLDIQFKVNQPIAIEQNSNESQES